MTQHNPSVSLPTTMPLMQRISTLGQQLAYARRKHVLLSLAGLGFSLLVALAFFLLGPGPAALAWLIFMMVVGTIFYNPRYGIYLIVGFTVAADGVLLPWYPMSKNLSSPESIMYLGRIASFSPLEILLALLVLSWLLRLLATRRFTVPFSPILFWTLIFVAFVALGFAYGIFRSGDTTIALWSIRSMFYLPIMVLMVSQYIETREHVRVLFWSVLFGLTFNALYGFYFVAIQLNWAYAELNEIAEHPLSIQWNTIFLLAAMLIFLARAEPVTRPMLWYTLLLLPFLLVVYIGNQRRAGYLALAVALIVFALLLFWFHRRIFLIFVLIPGLLFGTYLVAFWNVQSAPGAVAQMIRAEVDPPPDTRDSSSNLYRDLENANLLYTIRQAPLLGIGFGHAFYKPFPMADISFFIWADYIPHNSILWIWVQTGLGGFFAMMMLIGVSLALGARRLFQAPPGEMRAFAFVAFSYVLMHVLFTYLDIAWQPQSMVYLGAMLGLISVFDRIVAHPVAVPSQRWPWQPVPPPPPGLQQL